MYTVELYLRVRLACHVEGLSQRETDGKAQNLESQDLCCDAGRQFLVAITASSSPFFSASASISKSVTSLSGVPTLLVGSPSI